MTDNRRRILVVDDEPTILESVATRLEAEGFDVEVARDGPEAVELAGRLRPDLVVLDVMLPGFDGLEVCRRIQADTPMPVLMLTARVEETDMLVGLGVGADDYLTKPFSMRVLVARVNALLRRTDRAAQAVSDMLSVGPFRIDRRERRVYRGETEVSLTRTEFDLLTHFALRPRAVLAREVLLEQVWGWAGETESRTVDSHVKALRRKLGNDVIRTVHGVGYALDLPR